MRAQGFVYFTFSPSSLAVQSDNDYLTGKAPGLNGKTFSWVVGGKVAVSNDTEFFVHIFSRAKAG